MIYSYCKFNYPLVKHWTNYKANTKQKGHKNYVFSRPAFAYFVFPKYCTDSVKMENIPNT